MLEYPDLLAQCGNLRAELQRTVDTLKSEVPHAKLYDAFGHFNTRTREGALASTVTNMLRQLTFMGY